MFAQQLIGKIAIRTKGTSRGVVLDNSYTCSPVQIINATDSHIVFIYPEGSFDRREFGNKKRILNYAFCDDAWIDYEQLMMEEKPGTVKEAYDILNNCKEDSK